MLKNYRELKVWQKSFELCKSIYKITKKFPRKEQYSLTSQIRKSAISIPSNIAEGYGRGTTKEYIHFLYIAYGSICELETQILLSKDFGYISEEDKNDLLEKVKEVERMLHALIKSLKNKHLTP
jgi:four helix bundle protein